MLNSFIQVRDLNRVPNVKIGLRVRVCVCACVCVCVCMCVGCAFLC